jgi:hypothetical protein
VARTPDPSKAGSSLVGGHQDVMLVSISTLFQATGSVRGHGWNSRLAFGYRHTPLPVLAKISTLVHANLSGLGAGISFHRFGLHLLRQIYLHFPGLSSFMAKI